MSKRGIEAVREEEQADPRNFIFADLLDELYVHHIYPSLDATTLVAMFRVSSRFRDLVVPPAAWQRQIERYFPTSKEVFSEEYKENPYQLFVKEYKRHQEIIKDEHPSISMISVLAALNGEIAEINKVEGKDKLFLLSLMLSNGYFSVLELFNKDNGEDGNVISDATRFAALAGNKVVFDRLIKDLLLDSPTDSQVGEVYKEYFRHSLTSGRVEMAKYLMGKYIQLLRLTPEQNNQFLNDTVFQFRKKPSLATVQYLCSFKDDAGRSIVSDFWHILDYAVKEEDLEIVKFILEDKEHLLATDSQYGGFPWKLFTSAARNNQSEIFECIYKWLAPRLDSYSLEKMMVHIMTENDTSLSYSIVTFIGELKEDNGRYIIRDGEFVDCLMKGIRDGKHDLVKYFLSLSDKSRNERYTFNDLISWWFESSEMNTNGATHGYPKRTIQEKDILTLQVILNSIPSQMLKSVYGTLIQDAFSFYQPMKCIVLKLPILQVASKFVGLLSKIKDLEGKPYSLKKELMMEVMLSLPPIQGQPVTDFVKSLTDDEFNEIKTVATFYKRSDIVANVQAVRHQEIQISPEVSVISANPESEPPAKRPRL